jgi:hypothetical protein
MPKRTAKESGAKTAKTDKNTNPKCFFDISANEEMLGRIVFELFSDSTPKTAGCCLIIIIIIILFMK